jgi:hypothetical protein
MTAMNMTHDDLAMQVYDDDGSPFKDILDLDAQRHKSPENSAQVPNVSNPLKLKTRRVVDWVNVASTTASTCIDEEGPLIPADSPLFGPDGVPVFTLEDDTSQGSDNEDQEVSSTYQASQTSTVDSEGSPSSQHRTMDQPKSVASKQKGKRKANDEPSSAKRQYNNTSQAGPKVGIQVCI